MSWITVNPSTYEGVENAAEACAPRHASDEETAAFVNAVVYLTLGATGPYAGPWLRELAAIAAGRRQDLVGPDKLDQILKLCADVVFGVSPEFLRFVRSYDNDWHDPVDRRDTGRYKRLAALVEANTPCGRTPHGIPMFAADRLRTDLKKEVIARAIGRIVRIVDGANTVDAGRFVAASRCVPIREGDEVGWGRRGRLVMPFVKNGKAGRASRLVTMVLQHHGDYAVLVAAYAGAASPTLPGDPAESADSVPFWRSHALVWDGVTSLDEARPRWAE